MSVRGWVADRLSVGVWVDSLCASVGGRSLSVRVWGRLFRRENRVKELLPLLDGLDLRGGVSPDRGFDNSDRFAVAVRPQLRLHHADCHPPT